MNKLLDYTSRKFVLASACTVGAFTLAWYDKDVLAFTAAITAILAFYNGSDTMNNYFAHKNGKASTEAPKDN